MTRITWYVKIIVSPYHLHNLTILDAWRNGNAVEYSRHRCALATKLMIIDRRRTPSLRRADLAGDHAAPPVFFQPLSSFLLPAASRLSTLDDLPLAPFGERHDRQRCVAEHGTRAQTGGLQHRDPFAVGVQPNSLARMRDRAAVGFDITVCGFDAAGLWVEL